MANMTQELITRQTKMFGMTMEEVEAEFESAKKFGYDRLFFAMSILSDSQEAMAVGQVEMARQFINKAKYHMDTVRQESKEAK